MAVDWQPHWDTVQNSEVADIADLDIGIDAGVVLEESGSGGTVVAALVPADIHWEELDLDDIRPEEFAQDGNKAEVLDPDDMEVEVHDAAKNQTTCCIKCNRNYSRETEEYGTCLTKKEFWVTNGTQRVGTV